ncbi:MAG: hypothetical protein AAGJ18_01675 [Bacteroidota bacterium]
MTNHSTVIPKWIIYYGLFQILLIVGFGGMFFVNAEVFTANDPSFLAGVRNVGILTILVLGLVRKDAKILFCAYLLRFIVDSGDMISNFLGGETMAALSFLPMTIIPLFLGTRTLWKISKATPNNA